MKSWKPCTHISKFKREKFTKSLTSHSTLECSFQHLEEQSTNEETKILLCSDCGEIGCNQKSSNTRCIEKHCLSKNHMVMIDYSTSKPYCYKCEVWLNELLVFLQDDEKLYNNPNTKKLEIYLETVNNVVHNYKQRVVKKKAEHLRDKNTIGNPYK